MRRAVSISIGSSKRDKAVEINLLGQQVRIERIGTDGDMQKAAEMFRDLDGKVDAFGVGGADLGLMVDRKWYPLYSVQPMVRYIRKTPVVDGAGLKNTLESRVAQFMEARIGAQIQPKRCFMTGGADRWGMSTSFLKAGYECIFGDLMFALGIPIPLRTISQMKRLASIMMPVAGRLPFKWVYPTGEEQEKRVPKFTQWYDWAGVIAGDCLYIKHHMPDLLAGKVICTNTTTPQDVEQFRQAHVRYLVTTTPVFEGRSFGTNMMEAALVAASGKGRVLTTQELETMLTELKLEPQIQELGN